MKRSFLIFSLCVAFVLPHFAHTCADYERQMVALFDQIRANEDFSSRVALNDSLSKIVEQALAQRNSYDYGFDSVSSLGKIYSDDHKIRLYSWNIPLDSNAIFNLIVQKQSGEIYKVQYFGVKQLPDEQKHYNSADWYGALYYRAVPYTLPNKQTSYVVAGWSSLDEISQFKVLDVLYIDANDELNFGFPLFKDGETLKKRHILHYDADVIVYLDYDKRKHRFVFDNLWPMKFYSEDLVTYGPNMSFDGYVRKSKFWVKKDDLRVKN